MIIPMMRLLIDHLKLDQHEDHTPIARERRPELACTGIIAHREVDNKIDIAISLIRKLIDPLAWILEQWRPTTCNNSCKLESCGSFSIVASKSISSFRARRAPRS